MDLVRLRQLVGNVLDGLASMWTHREIGPECERVGLPSPPSASEGSKRERVSRSLTALADADLPSVAERIIAGAMPLSAGPAARYAIEDVLWADRGPEIPIRTRREIAQDLDLSVLARQGDRFIALLASMWVLDDPLDLFTGGSTGLRSQIERHVLRNTGDWSAEDLFEQLGAFEAVNTRFARFLEGMTSADVIPDEPAQCGIVAVVNPHLRAVGAELRETGSNGGYPVFSIVPAVSARSSRPKNLIFASLAKPDIRLRDAINNDIEIVGNADKVLVYDRPMGADGIRWRDLQDWWKETQNSLAMPPPRHPCTSGSCRASPRNRRRSAPCSSCTTRSTAAPYPGSPPCCQKSGCTGTTRPPATATHIADRGSAAARYMITGP